MTKDQISMMRAAAPKLPIFDSILNQTWQHIASSGTSLASEFQTHRFNGTENDRRAAISWIADRIEPRPVPERVIVTNGTMNSILLLASFLVGAGNVLLSEELTFPISYTLAKITGAQVHPVEIDHLGIIPDDFERKCQQLKPKAIYINCTVHSPTAYVTPPQRRAEIVRIARKYGVAILEDEAQALYLPDAPPSFATLAPDITWYMMGLSKYLSLGIRVGYIVGPSTDAIARFLERLRPVTTWHPAPILAHIVTHWIETGQAQQVLSASRDEVHRRQAIASEMLQDLPGFRGSLGIHFWLRAPEGVDSATFSAAIGDAGVIVRPSRLYSGERDPRQQGIRPGVGEPSTSEDARRALEIIRDVYVDLQRPPSHARLAS